MGSEYTGNLPVKERKLIMRLRLVSKSKGASRAQKAVEYRRIIGVAYLCLNSIRDVLLPRLDSLSFISCKIFSTPSPGVS